MVASTETTLSIVAAVKNYEWGVCGSASLVGRLSTANTGDALKESMPYAELWMGTHPSAPSLVKTGKSGSSGKETHSPLKEHLSQDLPFLFKVLSVGKALSIQAHPDAELAKKLHASDPQNYPDPNHKPEMAIALGVFEALCGFRPLKQILAHLTAVPEMATLAGESAVLGLAETAADSDQDKRRSALCHLFSSVISADADAVGEQTEKFKARISSKSNGPTTLESVCLRLNQQYPREVGCFCVFLLNYMVLEEGEAIFLAANEPHAYLSGDCVECMALSDNVVRAGLTPKFRDVPTLLHMLTFETYEPQDLAMKPVKLAGRPNSLLYAPPVPEFAVVKVSPGAGVKERVATDRSDSILLCIAGDLTLTSDGNDTKVAPGSILVLKKNSQCTLTSHSSPTLLFQAFCPHQQP